MNTITQSEIELSERLQKACLERGITELRFVAQDSDGEWWHYTTMPTELNQAWGNCVGNTFLFIGKNTVNWRETLMEWNPNAGVPIAEMQQLERELAEVTGQRDALIEGLEKLASCDWVITLPDRMDAVREIARDTLNKIQP